MEAFAKRKRGGERNDGAIGEEKNTKRGADGARIELETGREEVGFENVRERTREEDFGPIVEE